MIVTLLRDAQTIHALVKPTSIRRERWKMIKSAVLAAVAVVGIGSAAGAATVTTESYNFHLRYDGTVYEGFEYYDLIEQVELSASYVPIGAAPTWLKPQKFASLSIGDIIQFSAIINYLSSPIYDSNFGNGGTAPICQIGPVSCTDTNMTAKHGNDEIVLGSSDVVTISTNAKIGGFLSYSNWTLPNLYTAENGRYYYGTSFEDARFTIVQPAPVPLPASAALLPFGLGALAMMRKRRRKTI